MYFLLGAIIMVLAFMAYQDFKYRGIYWWLFPLLFVGLIGYGTSMANWNSVYRSGMLNIVFLLLQVVFLTFYISVKNRRLTNIFNGFFGLGDLLFLCCVACCFSTLNYVLFYVLGLLLTIIVTMAAKLFVHEVKEKIPLAGYQSLLLIGLMTIDRVQGDWNMVSDQAVFNFIGI